MKKPRNITVGREQYESVVLRVVESDEMGRPLLLKPIRDDEIVELSEDKRANRFHVAFFKKGQI